MPTDISQGVEAISAVQSPIQLVALLSIVICICICFYLYTRKDIKKETLDRIEKRDREQAEQNYEIKTLRTWQMNHLDEHRALSSKIDNLESSIQTMQVTIARIDSNIEVFQKFIMEKWSFK